MKKAGITIRNGGFYNIKYSCEFFYKIKELYDHGKYTTEIDNMLGLRRGTSQYILNKNNINLRHRGPKSRIDKENFFDDIDSEEKAYFLGYIMADGNVSLISVLF